MANAVKIKSIEKITHDVLHIVAQKPGGLQYHAGQAVDVSINKPGWEKELRPFTFTSLPTDNQIEFTIKTYPAHNGVTNQLLLLQPGDELLIGEVFGDIAYKGEGVFIAGGAGITPFLAILKQLEKENKIGNNKLLFANNTQADIINKEKLTNLLGNNFINILSNEKKEGFENGFITAGLIQKHTGKNSFYYLCGPPPMMAAIENQLALLGVKSEYIVKEAF
ncbi:MAG: flavodoxin reductase [Chitinophagaceae bacterium]|jgi:ferredoxin-NADP reductase|nr:flavodoxin reductase [Chitinophagaceae bacterium]MBP6046118.1 flavodoxin reductase [Ferruginibacter sp.]MBK7088543.1 flavodoxin reductase [Chitinophagaceae bacterium]MBK8775669.1 flavodoxin reductase [Chitinophagaceae bacterium]MBK8930058.1 flavodoxin reductase [Chitinophagaceae bacterium]